MHNYFKKYFDRHQTSLKKEQVLQNHVLYINPMRKHSPDSILTSLDDGYGHEEMPEQKVTYIAFLLPFVDT